MKMIRKNTVAVIILFLLTLTSISSFASHQAITLSIPKSILVQIVKDVLPIQINTYSEAVSGELTVVKVEQIKLGDQHVSCIVRFAGRNFQLITELMGHEVKMKVGNIDLGFACNAVIRFDQASQTLFIRPVVVNQTKREIEQSADIGRLIVGLLNGREFPVSLDRLAPIIFNASNKTIFIDNYLSDIQVSKDGLLFKLLPRLRVDSH